MYVHVISKINLLFKNFSLSKIWTFSQSKSWKFNIMFSNYRISVSVPIYMSTIQIFCFPVCPTYDASQSSINLVDHFYYQILGERSFIFLWIYLICYRWKTLILLVSLQIENFSDVKSIYGDKKHNKLNWQAIFNNLIQSGIIYYNRKMLNKYWVVRKVRADFEGKLKRRRFKFLISFIKFKSFAARTFRTTQYITSYINTY